MASTHLLLATLLCAVKVAALSLSSGGLPGRDELPLHDKEPGALARTLQRSFLELGESALSGADETDASHAAGIMPLFDINVTYSATENVSWQSATLLMNSVTGHLEAIAGIDPSAGVAWGHFIDSMETNGWSELTMETADSPSVSNTMRLYGAGYVEGLLTATRLSQFYSNMWQGLSKNAEGSAALVNIENIFRRMLKYVAKETRLDKGVSSPEPVSGYWKHVRYQLAQVWGLRDGYNEMAKMKGVRQLTALDLLLVNSHAILPEMMEAFTPKAIQRRTDFQTGQSATFLQRAAGAAAGWIRGLRGAAAPSADEPAAGQPLPAFLGRGPAPATAAEADRDWERRVAKHGHCSALIRLAPENRELMIGHSTWSDYSKMTRIFKYYKFKLPNAGTAVKTMGFSSYPGCLGSTDNFYMMDSGLVTMDTSLEVLNVKVYDRIPDFQTSPYIPNFMHVVATNRMAHTSSDWTSIFARQTSGFPSSQWMVVDYNKFHPGSPIAVNTVRLLEQVPGIIRHDDISETMRGAGYWASYNRPFFEEIRKASGHTQAQASFGALYSFDKNPRALIFGRVAGAIADLFSMRHAMRRNAYPHEDVMPNEPGHAISARMDLDVISHIPNGGIDSKVVNRCLMKSMQCQAESGPSHDSQAVFRWQSNTGSDLFPGWPHMGLPSQWNFGWVQMTPSSILDKPVDKCSR